MEITLLPSKVEGVSAAQTELKREKRKIQLTWKHAQFFKFKESNSSGT